MCSVLRSGLGPGGPVRALEAVSHGVPNMTAAYWPASRSRCMRSHRGSRDRSCVSGSAPSSVTLMMSASEQSHPSVLRWARSPSSLLEGPENRWRTVGACCFCRGGNEDGPAPEAEGGIGVEV